MPRVWFDKDDVCIGDFEKFWNKCDNKLQYGGSRGLYGTGTAFTLKVIWGAIQWLIQLTDEDVVADFGLGEGKFLHSISFFCNFPDMQGFGWENAEQRYHRSLEILAENPLPNCKFNLGNSAEVKNWAPATIIYNYDGSPQTHIELEHRTIMLNIFRSESVRLLFTTKMSPSVWRDYFAHNPDWWNRVKREWVVFKTQKLSLASHKIKVVVVLFVIIVN